MSKLSDIFSILIWGVLGWLIYFIGMLERTRPCDKYCEEGSVFIAGLVAVAFIWQTNYLLKHYMK